MAVALPFIAIAMTAVATAATIKGQQDAAGAAQDQAKYQAAVAQNNATIAEQNATSAVAAGESKAQLSQLQTAQAAGRAKAAFASAGIDVNQGTPVGVLSDVARAGMFDALTIKNNAQREAYGYRVAASQNEAQGGLYLAQGASAQSAANVKSFGSILGGSSSIADKYLKFQQVGVPSFGTTSGTGSTGSWGSGSANSLGAGSYGDSWS